MRRYLYQKRKQLRKYAWKYLKAIFRMFSLSVVRIGMGTAGYQYDLIRLLKEERDRKLIIFDVGANKGQSCVAYSKLYKDSKIYSFEPDPITFKELEGKIMKGHSNIQAFMLALGEEEKRQKLFRTESSDGSSLLAVSEKAKIHTKGLWTTSKDEVLVDVTTLDMFCKEKSIDQIDLLKIDTQGYELKVLKGGMNMLSKGCVRFIFLEVLFADFYTNQSDFISVYQFITSQGYVLIDFYNKGYLTKDHRLAWCDVLFRHNSVAV